MASIISSNEREIVSYKLPKQNNLIRINRDNIAIKWFDKMITAPTLQSTVYKLGRRGGGMGVGGGGATVLKCI